jgi:hypothetical protein
MKRRFIVVGKIISVREKGKGKDSTTALAGEGKFPNSLFSSP